MQIPSVLIGALVGALAAVPLSMVVQARRRQTGRVECALRAGQPTPDLPVGKWRHGTATVLPGMLRFRPAGPGGMRFPRGEPFDLPVLAASVQEGRRPALRQAWSINPLLRLALLRTPYGDIELAAPRRSLTALLDAVRRPPHP